MLYKQYSQFTGQWRWPNFTAKELSCNHCGEYFHDEKSLDCLQKLRTLWGKPLVLTCAHRCKVHNKAVGGVANSEHLEIAFDCAMLAAEQARFAQLAKQAGFTGIGMYPGRNFVHLDCGKARTWQG